MKRIAFLVEPQFMSQHHGVRNFIGGLWQVLAREHRVDLISFFAPAEGQFQFYRLAPKSRDFARNNGICDEACFEGEPLQVWEGYISPRPDPQRATANDFYYSHIGRDLTLENYDLCVITNPWMVRFDFPLQAKARAGIIYDLVPNTYILNNDQKPFEFAAEHTRGFRYFLDYCDSIFCISPAVENDFRTYFARDDRRVVSLPPVMPASFADVAMANDSRPRNVVLAAPLDLRKGVLQIPEIVNAAADEIETLYMFGGVRCERKHVENFFRQLRVKRVAWWPNASADVVHRLFHESKVLLFPSSEEGLGLPILEAQYCGCRVMVRNRAPMNKLTLSGHEYVSGNANQDGAALKSMIVSDFAHAKLQQAAKAEFDSRFVRDTVFRALGWGEAEGVLPFRRAA